MPDVQKLPFPQLHLRRVLIMKDHYGRKVNYLRLSVTELCNLRCRYCMPEEGVCKKRHEEMLTEEEMIQAVEIFCGLGIDKVRITGGDPLVKKNIVSICRQIAAIPQVRELCLTTNGLRLPELAKPLQEAGVDRVNISLDTLDPDKYHYITRWGHVEDALAGIEAALEAGFKKVKLNTVLVGGFNDDEIEALCSLSVEHPWEMRFIELMPMGPCADWDESCFLSVDEVLHRLPNLEILESQGVARRYRLPGAEGTIGLISPLSHEFCSQCSRIRVTADGQLKGCLHSREEIPLRGLHGPELEVAIRRGIAQKPAQHHLTERPSDTLRCMSQIGG